MLKQELEKALRCEREVHQATHRALETVKSHKFELSERVDALKKRIEQSHKDNESLGAVNKEQARIIQELGTIIEIHESYRAIIENLTAKDHE